MTMPETARQPDLVHAPSENGSTSLHRLLPTDFANVQGRESYWWTLVRESILRSHPPIEDPKQHHWLVVSALAALLAGYLTAWIGTDRGKVLVVGTTLFTEEPLTRTRNLLVYSMWGPEKAGSRKAWDRFIAQLVQYAGDMGAANVIGYIDETNAPALALARRAGGDLVHRLAKFPTRPPEAKP